MQYVIERAPSVPELPADWDSPFWSKAATLQVANFHPRSQSTHPRTDARVLYDRSGLYLHFRVADRWVRAAHTEYQSPVCQDSCAEFFVRPNPAKGYFNFEINPIGTMLLFYVTDPTRVGPGLKEYQPVPAELAAGVRIQTSMRQPVPQEVDGDVNWWLQYFVPFALFERYVGPIGDPAGQQWTANFYKCGDKTSRPHWASWAPVGEALNFHQPDKFGRILFAK